MSHDSLVLFVTSASLGFFHTVLGPDHYLPFIAMSRSGKWSLKKTTVVTVCCGIGHVLSSVALGILGIAFGIAVTRLEAVESIRGQIAAWALIAFGLVYMVWGLRQASRNKRHEHFHGHRDGSVHRHSHDHRAEHTHVHGREHANSITPWVLFTIFVFGPCEPLIPLLMYPAAQGSLLGVSVVVGLFGGVTILTMLSIVLVSGFGMNLVPTTRLERYTHAVAGATILLCGISVRFLGL